MQGLLAEMPLNCVINISDTNARSVAGGIWTWVATGSDSGLCALDNDEKEGVTVMAAIDAAGNKLPLTMIGKGKKRRRLAAFNRS
jgi:hypothetical protein